MGKRALVLVVGLLLWPSSGWAIWNNEANVTRCDSMNKSFPTCRNNFTVDAAQNTPVLNVNACETYTVDLLLSGGATATGFIQTCTDATPTACADLHTGALNGTTIVGYNNAGPGTFIRGRMTAVTLGAGTAHLKATCGGPH